MKNKPTILALDFGGSKLSAAVLHKGTRNWLDRAQAIHSSDANAQIDLVNMLELANRVLGTHDPDAIGISFGGPVDYKQGIIEYSPHSPGWESYPLKAFFEQRYGVPVDVANDANSAALGEFVYGAGQGATSLIYITISTGIGAGIIMNGKLWLGVDEKAGELGHFILDENGPACPCGKNGCLEAFASGPAIARIARQEIVTHPNTNSIILDLVNRDLKSITSKTVAQAAEKGDQVAISILDHAAAALGIAIANTANLINPERFILGGGVMKSGDMFINSITKYAQVNVQRSIRVNICRAALDDDSPLWGAVVLAEVLTG